ncbi:MAG: PIN domain-containing protein [Verrucomicrobiae bacterium]|nr:PIN domain-containing protein [Verrucomicrobiae bacterium]
MNSFPDTSFLCSVYRTQVHSAKADAFMAACSGPLPVTSLLLLEFRQSVRLQSRLHARDKTKGFPKHEANLMLRDLQSDLATKVIAVAAADWAEVHQLAEHLSAKYTEQNGHRLADLLHVATALHLGVAEFLTFDANQKLLAKAEGMRVPW